MKKIKAIAYVPKGHKRGREGIYLTFFWFSYILSYRFNLYNYISRTSRLTSLVLSYWCNFSF